MYLSKLVFNRQLQGPFQRDLSSFEQMHRTIWRAFSHDENHWPGRILFRYETVPERRILVQSEREPDWSFLGLPYMTPPLVKEVGHSFVQGQKFIFMLKANTAVNTYNEQGQKVRVGIWSAYNQSRWMERKAKAHGFSLINYQIGQSEKAKVRGAPYALVDFFGALQVDDPEEFQKAFEKGIGPGKAFGAGMLCLNAA